MAEAYALACELFSASLRPSGKTFLAHVVGTAGIAVESGASVDEAVAALPHAAYFHGDFGDGGVGVADQKRAEVRGVVGSRAEQLIADYGSWSWKERLATLQREGVDALAGDERLLARLRVANEIEDWMDLAVAYVPERAAWVLPLSDAVACAHLLDLPRLAEIANAVEGENAGRMVPRGLQWTTPDSERVPPRSMLASFRVQVRDQRARLRRIVRRVARRVSGARRVRNWFRRSTRP